MVLHRLELYTSSGDQAAAEALLTSVMGFTCTMTTQGAGRYVGLEMEDSELIDFKAGITGITSAKWYQCSNEEYYSRILEDSNVAAASAYTNKGVKWTWRNNEQANAGTGIAVRRAIAYCSPDGLSTNAGSITAPLDLRSALLQSPVAAPIIYLREGTHDITADTTISAALEIRNYAGEDAYIRLVSPSAPTVRGLTVANTGTFFEANSEGGMLRIGSEPSSRVQANQDAYPNMGRLDISVTANEDGVFRGLYLHDLLTVAYQSPTGGTLFKDCVLWNFGYTWTGASNGNGEFMYLQNAGAEEKTGADNAILGPVYGLMSQIYGQSGGINDIALHRIIGLSQKSLWASSASPIQNLRLENSLLLHGAILFGAGSEDNVNVIIRDNYLVARTESLAIGKWAGGDISNNVIVALGNRLLSCNVASPDVVYDFNSYYNPNNLEVSNGTGKTFAQWKAGGRDTNSTHVIANPENYIQVNPCESGKMVAFIGVSNIQSLNTVDADVSGLGLVNGESLRLRQAYDPLEDYSDFVYDGSGSIELNFVGRTIAIPIGDSVALETLSIQKGAWILERL